MEHCYWNILSGFSSLLEVIERFSISALSQREPGLSLSISNQQNVLESGDNYDFQYGIKFFLLGLILFLIYRHIRSGEFFQNNPISSEKISKLVPWGCPADRGTTAKHIERRDDEDDDLSPAF